MVKQAAFTLVMIIRDDRILINGKRQDLAWGLTFHLQANVTSIIGLHYFTLQPQYAYFLTWGCFNINLLTLG